MLLDFGPLIKHRDFRLLYIGQLVSFFGTMITYVAIPYQVFELTHSSFQVGLVALVQLVPLIFMGLLGGSFADSKDRRSLLIWSELLLALCSVGLVVNSLQSEPRLWPIFIIAALMAGLNAFHRPALEALTPQILSREEIPAASSLNSLRSTIGMVGGPAVGGVAIATFGLGGTYTMDVCSFVVSLLALSMIRSFPVARKIVRPHFQSIMDGLKYARSRPELMGTYGVDMIAMIFGMPMALFPAVAEMLGGGPKVLGWLYAAPSVGALIVSLTSGWAKKVNRHGVGVILGASLWGLAIVFFGYSTQVWTALFFLALAGGADMVSVIFRATMWNQTIPLELRGRLAGIELISYASGPIIGNAEAGFVASVWNVRGSIVSGGVVCVLACLSAAWWLPEFWDYDATKASSSTEVEGQPLAT